MANSERSGLTIALFGLAATLFALAAGLIVPAFTSEGATERTRTGLLAFGGLALFLGLVAALVAIARVVRRPSTDSDTVHLEVKFNRRRHCGESPKLREKWGLRGCVCGAFVHNRHPYRLAERCKAQVIAVYVRRGLTSWKPYEHFNRDIERYPHFAKWQYGRDSTKYEIRAHTAEKFDICLTVEGQDTAYLAPSEWGRPELGQKPMDYAIPLERGTYRALFHIIEKGHTRAEACFQIVFGGDWRTIRVKKLRLRRCLLS